MFEMCERPGERDEVDAFGSTASENDFLRGAGVDKLRGAFARGFVGAGCAVAQFVDAAVDVCIIVFVVADDGIDDLPGFLAARRAVEVNERVAIDFLIEDREVISQPRPLNAARRTRRKIDHDGCNLAGDPAERKDER